MTGAPNTRWSDSAYSLRRYYVDEFHFRYVASLAGGSRVLDLGGHRIRKRGRFDIGRYGLDVTTVDLTSAKSPDVQADARSLPFRDRSFDAVVCSEVLQFVPDPAVVLAEIHRTLREGGRVCICVPFLFPQHGDPIDYARYTDAYWRDRLAVLGFSVEVVERQGAFWSVLVDQMRTYAAEGLAGPSLGERALRIPLAAVIPLAKRFAVWRDARPQPRLPVYATGFGVVARRI